MAGTAPGSVSREVLEAKLQEVEATTDLDEQSKTKLLELYQKALKNLQGRVTNANKADVFEQVAKNAPAEIQALREATEKQSLTPADDTLDVSLTTALRQVEQLLQKEKSDLAAAETRQAEIEKLLAEEKAQPELIRFQLTEANEQLEEVATQLKIPQKTGEDPALSEAKQWALETQYQVLNSQINLLNQELLSLPSRVDLLKAKRDRAAASVEWVGKRVKILGDLVASKRQEEAEQVKASAEETRRDAEGKHPLVVAIAEQNAALSEEIANMASELEELSEQRGGADRMARQIEDDFRVATETMAIGGFSQELGQMLHQQRRLLPDLHSFRRQAEDRENKAAQIGVRRLRHRQEQKQLRHIPDYVSGVLAETPAEEPPELHKELYDYAAERKTLLEKSVEFDDLYLRTIGELGTAQQRLLGAIEDYDAFLDEHLLWVRSSSHAELQELGALPEQVWRIISPTGWLEVANTLAYQAWNSPMFVLLALTLGVLLWSRTRLVAAIHNISGRLGKPMTDRVAYSLQALGLSLIVASAWPLVMVVTGWQLKTSLQATDFSNAVGESLLVVAKQIFFLRAFYQICLPDGLAAAHFRWPEASLRLLRSELNRLTWIFLPAATVLLVVFYLDPLNAGWAIGRTAFIIIAVSLAFAFYRLLRPKQGVLAGYIRRSEQRTFRRLHRLWYPLLVGVPLALGALYLLGYSYTAGTLLGLLLDTTWMAVVLLILDALAKRWLLVIRRRLAYEAAMERQLARAEAEQEHEKMHAGEDGITMEVHEPEVDLVALSDTSRDLLNTAVIVFGIIGLWMVWSDVLPALLIFDDMTLWHHTVTEGGVDMRLPITLADIGLALIFVAATVVLAKKLPAVLEIILLNRFDMSSGSRYTVTTLTTYSVVTIGLLLVFDRIGAQWSQLQWLVAALGVGIGFGLQEIVANFISGLIILFERPIRVGDVVTVGDTDGVVTRIRIRATTIRNWDGKELLVPNKEFITGRLLNWSLSDQTTRILISVGIAYGANVRQAMGLLEAAAREHADVLDEPEPSVIFEGFGDNALTLVLRCFVETVDLRLLTLSALNQTINDKFNKAGIVIAFPQRDLHLDTLTPLRVSIENVPK